MGRLATDVEFRGSPAGHSHQETRPMVPSSHGLGGCSGCSLVASPRSSLYHLMPRPLAPA